MDYRIVDKEAFTVTGKIVKVSSINQQHTKQIPKFWDACMRDGTLADLGSLAAEGNLLGVCLEMNPNTGGLTYMIGCEIAGSPELEEAYVSRAVPASTWAVFTSEGPLPDAIQGLFRRIHHEWFPTSGYKHANAPDVEVYPPGDTMAPDYHCQVWIPVLKS